MTDEVSPVPTYLNSMTGWEEGRGLREVPTRDHRSPSHSFRFRRSPKSSVATGTIRRSRKVDVRHLNLVQIFFRSALVYHLTTNWEIPAQESVYLYECYNINSVVFYIELCFTPLCLRFWYTCNSNLNTKTHMCVHMYSCARTRTVTFLYEWTNESYH